MSGPTWVIDTACERGVPLSAHCERCGLVWVRPDDDEWADSLPATSFAHRRLCRG